MRQAVRKRRVPKVYRLHLCNGMASNTNNVAEKGRHKLFASI
jgi:hypothetical protein